MMKAIAKVVLLAIAFLAVGLAEEKPLLDLSKVPLPSSGKTIAPEDFRSELKGCFTGGSFSFVTRTLPTIEDLSKMLEFFQLFLDTFYPGQKILGLLGLLILTPWKDTTLVLYTYKGEFQLAFLTTQGWYRVVEDPKTSKIRIEPLSLEYKPSYLST